jgi:thiol-disulfide isomerase/thioredoxin
MLFMDSKMRRNMIKYKSVFFCGEQENNGKIKVEVMTMNKKVIGMILLTALLTACGAAKENGGENSGAALDAGSTEVSEETKASDDAMVSAEAEGTVKVWGQMPSFTAKDLEGNTVTEDIFAQKDLTVVNIWGTFCPPCIEEMPELGAWAEEMPDNVQMIGLIIDIAGEDDKEHHDMAVTITERAGAAFTQVIANNDFADILQEVVGVPTTLFVDKEGNLVGEPVVGAYVDGYKQFVEEYLSGQ